MPAKNATRSRGCRSVLGLGAALVWLAGMPLLAAVPGGDEGELPDAFPSPAPQAYLSHAALPAGATGTLLVTLEVAPGFHIQINDFLEFLVAEDAPISIGPWSATRLARWHEDEVLKDRTALKAPVTVHPDAPPGPLEVEVRLGYQGCAEEPIYACFPPDEAVATLAFEVLPAGAEPRGAHTELFAAHGGPLPGTRALEGAGAADATGAAGDAGAGAGAGAAEDGNLARRLEGALASGSLVAFLLVFLGGILTSFTPCVYPMIPITISYVGGRAKNRMHGFVLSLFFVLGIAIMYSGLGLVAAATGSIFGAAMQSTPVLIGVALIFAAMGASMLGAFDLALPSSMQGRMTAGAQRGGIVGAILMGMVTGLVASPCVGPVLVVLLTFVAKSGSLLLGFWLLFTFACGLGMLFLVLGVFASAINALPGAGGWMDTVKHVFGVILIAMAIYYLRLLIGPDWTRFAFGVYLVIVGVYSGAFTPLPEGARGGLLLRKALGLLLFFAGLFLFLLWLALVSGAPALLFAGAPGLGATAGPGAAGALEAHPGPAWRINDEAALEEARAAGRPVVMDFYADWCTACVELDERTWIDPEVIAEAGRFVAIKMDFTKRGEFSQAATERYAIKGMPTVIFFDGSGAEVTRFFGFKGPDEVLAIMREIR